MSEKIKNLTIDLTNNKDQQINLPNKISNGLEILVET